MNICRFAGPIITEIYYDVDWWKPINNSSVNAANSDVNVINLFVFKTDKKNYIFFIIIIYQSAADDHFSFMTAIFRARDITIFYII